MVGLYGQVGPPTGPTTAGGGAGAARQAVERSRTVLTEEDVRLAEQRRESDRTLAAMMNLDFASLGPRS